MELKMLFVNFFFFFACNIQMGKRGHKKQRFIKSVFISSKFIKRSSCYYFL